MNSIKLIFLTIVFSCPLRLNAQLQKPVIPDSLFSTYYHQRVSHFKSLPQTKGDIIFLGNSITDGGEWQELFGDVSVKNRGISGDVSAGIIHRIDEIVNRRPAKVFLMIGTNDLARGIKADSLIKNTLWIGRYLKEQSPSSKLFVQSILPVNDAFGKFAGHTSKVEAIAEVNAKLRANAATHPFTYVDLHSSFCDASGKLDAKYTNDGLHLTGDGYMLWKHLVYPLVYDLQPKAAIIPFPQMVTWQTGVFPLYQCNAIVVKDTILLKEAYRLQSKLLERGKLVQIKRTPGDKPYIELGIEKVDAEHLPEEAYHLQVTTDKVKLTANTMHGIFNGIQTLLQLCRDGVMIDACEITDWPAFAWRGYMVDVGRNFQSIDLLKQQIEVMARAKLNVFHLHLTEDIAWRLQSKRYPRLTDSKNMLRNPGEYYTLNEMRELIAYCKEKYITLIPEIDMPGHSEAFKRTMGTDMQSEEGVKICGDILGELCSELDVPFVHIGGDEVKITNRNFLPGMVARLKSLGRKVVAWDPGGNLPEGIILQMWTGNTKPKSNFPSVDSRHLYLNHFDPIDGVVATFNHKICDSEVGDEHNLGAILCNWPDRRVSNELHLITMNAVYPIMLSFAERCWQGKGWGNYLSDIGDPSMERYNAFTEFENRLLDHKILFFKNLHFPYVKQSNIEWKLVGPFNNRGATETKFAPEEKGFLDMTKLNDYPSVYGGTIWLRHFWHPMIQSHLKDPKDSSTYYAITKIWSDEDGEKDFWISFNNLSRSTATDSPPSGKWNINNGAVWVNGKLISPPKWKNASHKGNSEVPLTDEGYEYREPTKILLQNGWNTVLVKAPVATFKGEWQNPVKWMFTMVRVD